MITDCVLTCIIPHIHRIHATTFNAVMEFQMKLILSKCVQVIIMLRFIIASALTLWNALI